MNLFLVGTVIFVIIYLFLNWFAKTSSKKIAQFLILMAKVYFEFEYKIKSVIMQSYTKSMNTHGCRFVLMCIK